MAANSVATQISAAETAAEEEGISRAPPLGSVNDPARPHPHDAELSRPKRVGVAPGDLDVQRLVSEPVRQEPPPAARVDAQSDSPVAPYREAPVDEQPACSSGRLGRPPAHGPRAPRFGVDHPDAGSHLPCAARAATAIADGVLTGDSDQATAKPNGAADARANSFSGPAAPGPRAEWLVANLHRLQ